ncbi:DUF4118 domain-containing protein [Nitrospira sp. CMX1]|nr:DUF4118 domain-containing protein [Nitrospira sp.]
MTFHVTVRTDKGEPGVGISTGQCAAQHGTLVETSAQSSEPLTGSTPYKKTVLPLSIGKQYGIALGSTFLAFLVRIIADSYLGDTLPFVTFLLAIAVTTWYGGIGASLTALVLGALVWNWFFVNPRYAFSLGSHGDQADMTVYLTIGVAMIGYAQTWRWAWKQSEEMAEALQRERVRGTHPSPPPSRIGRSTDKSVSMA